MLPCCSGIERDLAVKIVGDPQNDHIDFIHLEQLPMTREMMWNAVFPGERLGVSFRG